MAKNNLPIWCRENFSVRPERSIRRDDETAKGVVKKQPLFEAIFSFSIFL
jgi:hypothetical protein